MSDKLVIHGSVLGELGKRFEVKTDISPLHIQKSYAEIGPSELEKANILEDNQQLSSPIFEEMIVKLAKPVFFGRFRYSEGIGVKETTVYFDQDKELICGMTTGMDEMVTLDPAINIGDEIDQVTQLIGQSVIQYNEFDQELTLNESIALAGMIDLYRKNMYQSIGMSRMFDPELIRSEDVFREINNEKAQWIMWLSFILKQSIGLGKEFILEDIVNGLELLTNKGLLVKDGLKYKISKDVEELAVRMHMTDNVIVSNCGYAGREKVHVMGFVSAQFGLKDILMIDTSSETVNISSVSASQILKFLMDFMYNPMVFFTEEIEGDKLALEAIASGAIVDDPVEAVTQRPLDQSETQAQATGLSEAEAVKEFKFCIHCGTKIDKAAAFCPFCGGKLNG